MVGMTEFSCYNMCIDSLLLDIVNEQMKLCEVCFNTVYFLKGTKSPIVQETPKYDTKSSVKQIKWTNRVFKTSPSTNLVKHMKILLQNSTSLTAPLTLLQTSVEYDQMTETCNTIMEGN